MPKGIKGFQKGNNFGTNKTSFKKGQQPWNFGTSGKHNLVSYHSTVHQWLKRHFGKADICEDNHCDKTSKTFQWALKKNCEHGFDKKRYLKLCRKCHSAYDDWVNKMWATRRRNKTVTWKKICV